MDFESAIDFEFEDPFPVIDTKKRKKVIGLDDLFNDHKKEQEKIKKSPKVAKAPKYNESDDEDANETETELTETFNNFQQTIKEVDGHDIAINEGHKRNIAQSWGLEVFGTQFQRTPLELEVVDLASSLLSQKSLKKEVTDLIDISKGTEETFLRGLLLNGWLSKLIITSGYLEKSVARWTFNLLCHSSNELLMTSACDFWCSILLQDKVDVPVVEIEWLPGFSELKGGLESYGFRMPSQTVFPVLKSSEGGSNGKGPPANIRAWIKFANACFQARNRYLALSIVEVQELVETVIYLFLERKLLGLTVALQDCLLSAINFFEDSEWNASYEKVSKSIANRVPRDLNCLRSVECISGVDARSKQFRSTLAFEILRSCFTETTFEKDILKLLLSKNLKDKSCDLFIIYLHFVLMENWILFCAEAEPSVTELWAGVIRKCSSQISNTDFRPCAQEIRNRASYLLQSTSNK